MKKKYLKILFVLVVMLSLTSCGENKPEGSDESFQLLASSENREIGEYLLEFAKKNKIDLEIEYTSTIEIMQKLNANSKFYDGVFIANSMWTYMLENPYLIGESKPIFVEPVVWGIEKSKLKEIGLADKTDNILLMDIVDAIEDGKLKFLMPSPTQTNSGASSYFGFVNVLLDNPPFLTKKLLETEGLEEQLKSLFSGVERVSGEEGYIREAYLKGDYSAVVDYESSIISLNNELKTQGREELILVYPKDGVAISDVSFGFINSFEEKKESFLELQNFLLSQESQDYILSTGRRGGYGGYFPDGHENVFKKEWGIDVNKPLTAMKYPSKENIENTLYMYQEMFRKPSYTAFCLDYSGSMYGEGKEQLMKAMNLILDDNNSSKYFIQFTDKDQTIFYPFSSNLIVDPTATLEIDNFDMIGILDSIEADGGTDIYLPMIEALSFLETIPDDRYTRSIVMMTDGMSDDANRDLFEQTYKELNLDIPVYSIMFGEAEEEQLIDVSNLTNGKTFDGREDLINAFKTVRGFN